MSLIDNLRGKPGPKAAQPMPATQASAIVAKLQTAESELRALEAQHGDAALEAIGGEAGAQDRLETISAKLKGAREKISTLEAAHAAAVKRDEAMLDAQRTSLRKTQIAAMRKHLEARNAAAERFSAAMAEAAAQYRAMIDRSAKAMAACPIGSNWPQGTLCEIDPIRQLAQHEMFRLSATPGNRDGRTLPGAALPSANVEWQPQVIKPLSETLKTASDFVIAKLTGKEAA